jgi:hypothetical protein
MSAVWNDMQGDCNLVVALQDQFSITNLRMERAIDGDMMTFALFAN